jgi:hypothetical protein
MFNSGRTSVTAKERPSTLTNEENTEQFHALILRRRVSIDEATNQLQISHGSAYDMRLHFHEVCARWVSKQLKEQQRRNRLNSVSAS